MDFSALTSNEPIPAVSFGDLRIVWELMRDQHPGAGISVNVFAQACSPQADVIALWARSTLIDLLADQGLLSSWQRGAQLDDIVFEIAAIYPIAGWDRFDADDFCRRLGQASER